MLSFERIGSREGYQWYASNVTAAVTQGTEHPNSWYSLIYCLIDDSEESLRDLFSVHILHGSASAHFVGEDSHLACLLYSSLFDALRDFSHKSRPQEPLCSFSENARVLSAEEMCDAFWGGHMGIDCGSREGGLVIHSDKSVDYLRSLVMAKWPN